MTWEPPTERDRAGARVPTPNRLHLLWLIPLLVICFFVAFNAVIS